MFWCFLNNIIRLSEQTTIIKWPWPGCCNCNDPEYERWFLAPRGGIEVTECSWAALLMLSALQPERVDSFGTITRITQDIRRPFVFALQRDIVIQANALLTYLTDCWKALRGDVAWHSKRPGRFRRLKGTFEKAQSVNLSKSAGVSLAQRGAESSPHHTEVHASRIETSDF